MSLVRNRPFRSAGLRNPLPPISDARAHALGLSGIERGLSLSFVLLYLEY